MEKVHEVEVDDYVYDVLMFRERSYIELEDKKDSKGERMYNIGDFLNVREVKEGKSTGRSFVSEIKNISQEEKREEETTKILALQDVPKNFITYIELTDTEKSIFESLIGEMGNILQGKDGLESWEVNWYKNYFSG